jgi:hypothetical protein
MSHRRSLISTIGIGIAKPIHRKIDAYSPTRQSLHGSAAHRPGNGGAAGD